ncbi:MAG TPA: class I SAM-dependent methyltransferase [Gaiellaceae bacterium]|nr:class I SAM-dependent methyltransferase [Gaiellaceae bacterium]
MTAGFENISVEEVREYWNRRPCNIRHSPQPVGSKEYFDEVEARKYFVEPHIPGFAEFPRWRDRRVLEIGCGIGTDTVNFARHGAQVTVAELSDESMRVAQQRAEVFGLADRIAFHNGNAEELTSFVPVEQHDLVYSFGVIHHSPHPERILEEARHYLKPGGTLKVMVYNRRSWKVLWMVLKYAKGDFRKTRKLIAEHSEAQFGSPVTYAYTKEELREVLTRHGFRATDIFVDHIFPWRIPDYVEYRYVKVWYFRWIPQPLFRTLERLLGWHLCATATYEGG